MRCPDNSFNALDGDGDGDCTETVITLNEPDTAAWDSAITDLEYSTGAYYFPTNELLWSEGLALSCTEHVFDISVCGVTGHDGQDDSEADERADRYIMYESVGENLAYATFEDDDGIDVIMQFIIDDGVTGRGH